MPEGFWESLGRIPPAGLIAIGILAFLQLGLQVCALVDLARRRQVAHQAKWIWCLIIILGGLIGAIAYWTIGRRTASAVHIALPEDEAEDRSNRAMDVLYGSEKKS